VRATNIVIVLWQVACVRDARALYAADGQDALLQRGRRLCVSDKPQKCRDKSLSRASLFDRIFQNSVRFLKSEDL
jgi:hypothetical protein